MHVFGILMRWNGRLTQRVAATQHAQNEFKNELTGCRASFFAAKGKLFPYPAHFVPNYPSGNDVARHARMPPTATLGGIT
jgi:hypothetical protein